MTKIQTMQTETFPCKCKLLRSKDRAKFPVKCTCSHATQQLCEHTVIIDGKISCAVNDRPIFKPICVFCAEKLCLRTGEY
jgi:ribosomal protein L31E